VIKLGKSTGGTSCLIGYEQMGWPSSTDAIDDVNARDMVETRDGLRGGNPRDVEATAILMDLEPPYSKDIVVTLDSSY
jgi:hypothetical protein